MNSRLVPEKKNSSQSASAKKEKSQSASAKKEKSQSASAKKEKSQSASTKKKSSQTVSAKEDASILTTAKTDSRLHNATQTTSFLAHPEYFNYQRRQHENEHDNKVGAQYHSNAFLADYLKQNVPEPSADGPPSFYSRYDQINAIGFTKRNKTHSKDVIYDEDLKMFIRVTPEYNGYDLARSVVVNDDNISAQISLMDGSTMKTTDRKTGELFKEQTSHRSWGKKLTEAEEFRQFFLQPPINENMRVAITDLVALREFPSNPTEFVRERYRRLEAISMIEYKRKRLAAIEEKLNEFDRRVRCQLKEIHATMKRLKRTTM